MNYVTSRVFVPIHFPTRSREKQGIFQDLEHGGLLPFLSFPPLPTLPPPLEVGPLKSSWV